MSIYGHLWYNSVYMKQLRLTQPYALILVGVPGSGKTFFGEKFADTFNAPFVNASTIAAHTASLEDAYRIADLLVDELVRTSGTFIVETDTASRVRRTELARKLRAKGYQPLFVWMQTDEPTAYQRSRKQISDEEYAYRSRSFSPPHVTEHPLVISGKHTYASQAKVILNYLAKHNNRPEVHLEAPKRPEARPLGSSSGRSISVQ